MRLAYDPTSPAPTTSQRHKSARDDSLDLVKSDQ